MRDGRLILPPGKSGTPRIHLPEAITLPGRLLDVRLSYGRVCRICAVPDAVRPQQAIIGVALGGNTLAAATDGQRVILISGRAAKAAVQRGPVPHQAARQPRATAIPVHATLAPLHATATPQIPPPGQDEAPHP